MNMIWTGKIPGFCISNVILGAYRFYLGDPVKSYSIIIFKNVTLDGKNIKNELT